MLDVVTNSINSNQFIAWGVMAVAFAVLAKCADLFVESSVAMADRFKIPRLVIGIVMVSLATTTPEVSVSLIAALRGSPEMALGNAIGSVIVDDGLALALAGIMAIAPIAIVPHVLKTSTFFLVLVEILAFLFVAFDQTLDRWEGAVLVVLLGVYIGFLYYQHKAGRYEDDIAAEIGREIDKEKQKSILFLLSLFGIGLAGIIISSHFVIASATSIAFFMGIPQSVVALTLVALGTSIPEIATCIVAARKNEGALAVGNILGADILNICWVAGLSAVAHPLTLQKKEIFFMFPAMFIIVGVMLVMLRINYRLTRLKGFVLLGLYVVYIVSFFLIFPQHHGG